MSSCKKQCRVRRLRTGFRVLFRASCVFTCLEVLAVAIIAVCQLFEPASQWLVGLADRLVSRDFSGWKDVAMTVGLTGVLFAWLLQIIGDQTCGIQMDELFYTEFRFYTFLMAFFLQATIVCIFVCSAAGPWRLLAPITFFNMLCGIGGMWVMCAAFLFSTEHRRTIAFCALENRLEKKWRRDDLSLWARELNQCAARGEEEHIRRCFQLLRARADKVLDEKGEEACAAFCCEMIDEIWTQTGVRQWSRYMSCLLQKPYGDSVFCLLLSAYLLQAAKLGETQREDERYQAVTECLSRGTAELEKVPGDILILYLAFTAVYQFDSGNPVHKDVLPRLRAIRWDWSLNVAPGNEARYRERVLQWMVRSYDITFTYDHESFSARMQDPALQRNFDRFIKLYPWKYIG